MLKHGGLLSPLSSQGGLVSPLLSFSETMAEREGFEPSRGLAPPYRFSKPTPSASWVPLREFRKLNLAIITEVTKSRNIQRIGSTDFFDVNSLVFRSVQIKSSSSSKVRRIINRPPAN